MEGRRITSDTEDKWEDKSPQQRRLDLMYSGIYAQDLIVYKATNEIRTEMGIPSDAPPRKPKKEVEPKLYDYLSVEEEAEVAKYMMEVHEYDIYDSCDDFPYIPHGEPIEHGRNFYDALYTFVGVSVLTLIVYLVVYNLIK